MDRSLRIQLREIQQKMMTLWFPICLISSIFCSACQSPKTESSPESSITSIQIHTEGELILNRFDPPEGFDRIPADSSSFEHFLRNLPLLPQGSKVHYFDGTQKEDKDVYAAVIDLPIGNKNLHQCADAVMRLRADFLRSQHRSEEIHFHFTNGFDADYQHWMDGYRVQIKGNHCEWKSGASKGDNTDSYWNYLETVFTYAGTLSLSKELAPQDWSKMKIGDVLIQGGSPGHVVIIVDMAENRKTKEKVFMLAQSYMPAQELQVLYNPMSPGKSVWYSAQMNNPIETPEWTFEKSHLRKFL
jgi:hypothetical protein